MIVSVHQPEFLPWLGYFYKMSITDKFVLLDTVQFKKNNFQNRNQIGLDNQAKWITMPIKKCSMHTLIKDVEIAWQEKKRMAKHLNQIKQAYRKTKYFSELFPIIEDLFEQKPKYLAEFNIKFIRIMAELLGLKTEILLASDLALSGKAKGGTEVNLEISKYLGGNVYVSGTGGKGYLNVEKFTENEISVYFQKFEHPEYQQLNVNDFVPNLSSIDVYFNHGPTALDIICGGNISRDEVRQLEQAAFQSM